jgi:hypothetical protein
MGGPHDPTEPDAPGAPWWLRPLYVFGVPAAIAIFLVWFVTAVVAMGQTKLQDTLDAHVTNEQVDRSRHLIFLGLICQNTAQTERERNQCEAVAR